MEVGSAEEVKSSFEQQFKSHEYLQFPEGKIQVVDVEPEKLSDEVPVLLAPGWTENQHTYKKTLAVGYNDGRRVVTVSRTKDKKIESEEDQNNLEVEYKKARLLLNVLEKKGIEKVDMIAHSEGAINGLIAAILKPEQFRNIVLDKPAGLIGKDSKTALTGRFMKLLIQEAISRPKSPSDSTSSIRAGSRTVQYIVENSQKTLREMEAISSTDITDMIKILSEKGIKISIISGVDDPLYPVNRQISNMENSGNVPAVKGYYSVIGGHNELSIDAGRHAMLAFNALENLRDLKS